MESSPLGFPWKFSLSLDLPSRSPVGPLTFEKSLWWDLRCDYGLRAKFRPQAGDTCSNYTTNMIIRHHPYTLQAKLHLLRCSTMLSTLDSTPPRGLRGQWCPKRLFQCACRRSVVSRADHIVSNTHMGLFIWGRVSVGSLLTSSLCCPLGWELQGEEERLRVGSSVAPACCNHTVSLVAPLAQV